MGTFGVYCQNNIFSGQCIFRTKTLSNFISPPGGFTSPPGGFISPPGIFTSPPGGFISPPGGFTSPPGERGRKNPPDAPNLGGVGNISDGTRFARHPRKTFSEQVFPTPARPRTYFPDALKMGGVGHISAGKDIARLPQAGWPVREQR